jgi:hypothetical protein
MNPTVSQIPSRRHLSLAAVLALCSSAPFVNGQFVTEQPPAALVYDNGPAIGPVSYNIGQYTISDSFTVLAPTTLTSAHVVLNVRTFGVPASVRWHIGTTSGGAEISSGLGDFANTNMGVVGVFESAFAISGNLAGAGTYYLTLFSALTSLGRGDVFWWGANGPSSAYQYPGSGQIPSETFQLYGQIVCNDQTLCNDPGQCGATASFGPLIATNWPGYVVTIDPPSGSFFPVGTNTVTWTAVGSGSSGQLTNTCTFLVCVRDCEPPVIHSLTAIPASLWPPNHKMQPVTLRVSATDNCHVARAKIISVNSNESGSSDWEITGDLTLNLRAERSGNHAPRVYNITVECSDDFGNSSYTVVGVPVKR